MPTDKFKTSLAAAKKFLQQQQKHYSWPYRSGQTASIEATAWCALALRHQPGVAASVLEFYRQSQNPDGGWSTQINSGPSDWSSSLALLSMRLLLPCNQGPDSLDQPIRSCFERGLSWLINDQTDILKPLTKALLVLIHGPEVLQNHPPAWPWSPDTYYWVEPTSYALLALKPLSTSPRLKSVIQEGNSFLLHHPCQGGGWNRGDNLTLGVYQPAAPLTSAEALLALQDLPHNPVVQEGLNYLEKVSALQSSVLSLAWLAMARDAFGLPSLEQLRRLSGLQKTDGSFGDYLHLTGLAVCALDMGNYGNPLKFTGSP